MGVSTPKTPGCFAIEHPGVFKLMPAGYSFMPVADAILHGSFQNKQGEEVRRVMSFKL
jgi:hypothetical protein